MIERTTPLFGRLVFDRDAIVRAALRAYVESWLAGFPNGPWMPAAEIAWWTGDLEEGALVNEDGCGNSEVVGWNEAGVVGLACDLGSGPIEQLDLSIDAVTGGPDDVRGAVPGLPEELEPAFVIAVGKLDVGNHKEKLAGAGFWLCGDRAGGTLFAAHDLTLAWGTERLAAWGMLHNGRLLPLDCNPRPGAIVADYTRPEEVPFNALIDAVVDRRLKGPTELTAEEVATLICREPEPEKLLAVQQRLQEVGITWPGALLQSV